MTTHPFLHLGREYTLIKHPRYAGLPEAELRWSPWYLRYQKPGGKRTFARMGTPDNTPAAVAKAKALLSAAMAGADPYTQLVEQTRYRQTLTVQALGERWASAGYARQNSSPRTDRQQADCCRHLAAALPWWGSRGVTSIGVPMMVEYSDYRRAHNSGSGDGQRSVDLELGTLKCLFDWAVARGHIRHNPFTGRPRFVDSTKIRHAHECAPKTDEALHVLLEAVWRRCPPVAACLAYQALTGQRIGELAVLRWAPGRANDQRTPGTRFTSTIDGQTRHLMQVHREKHGINPAVRLHPALTAFLDAWQAYHSTHYAGSPWMFPWHDDPREPMTSHRFHRASGILTRAAEQVGQSHRTSHGMRAYYVSVRRSMGLDDGAIATEIGDGTGAAMIAKAYGSPKGITGDGERDWLPEPPVRPIWDIIATPADTTVKLDTTLDTILDTTQHPPQTDTNRHETSTEPLQTANATP